MPHRIVKINLSIPVFRGLILLDTDAAETRGEEHKLSIPVFRGLILLGQRNS